MFKSDVLTPKFVGDPVWGVKDRGIDVVVMACEKKRERLLMLLPTSDLGLVEGHTPLARMDCIGTLHYSTIIRSLSPPDFRERPIQCPEANDGKAYTMKRKLQTVSGMRM